MDIFNLSASITLDSSSMESGIARAKAALDGLHSGTITLTGAVESFSSSAGASMSSLGTTFSTAWTSVQASWSGASSYFSGIVSSISSAFSSLPSTLSSIGRQMWEGLKSGLSDAISGAGEWASDVVSSIKSALGIHSPSRVMMEVGQFMTEGLSLGWQNSIGSVTRQMQSSLALHTTQAKVDFAASAVGKSSSAIANGIMQTASEQHGGMIHINLNVDGRTLASVLFDPLTGVAKQKGVVIGA